MPELPELEVVREVLQRRIVNQAIAAVEVNSAGGPIVVRDLTRRGFEAALAGATLAEVTRRGKFILFSLRSTASTDPLYLVVNPKLTGRLQLAAPGDRRLPKTHVVFTLSGGDQLRYVDQKRMGQLYFCRTCQPGGLIRGM